MDFLESTVYSISENGTGISLASPTCGASGWNAQGQVSLLHRSPSFTVSASKVFVTQLPSFAQSGTKLGLPVKETIQYHADV
jgi:hypothetical protein